MAAPISPMLKYSIVYNLLNFPPILIKIMSKFIVYKVLYFKAQNLLRLCSPLNIHSKAGVNITDKLTFTLTFLIFPRKQDMKFHANCMKCQILFSGKKNYNISICRLMKSLAEVLSVNFECSFTNRKTMKPV